MSSTAPVVDNFIARWSALRTRAQDIGADALVIGGGSDLFYLTGHDGHSYDCLLYTSDAADE